LSSAVIFMLKAPHPLPFPSCHKFRGALARARRDGAEGGSEPPGKSFFFTSFPPSLWSNPLFYGLHTGLIVLPPFLNVVPPFAPSDSTSYRDFDKGQPRSHKLLSRSSISPQALSIATSPRWGSSPSWFSDSHFLMFWSTDALTDQS